MRLLLIFVCSLAWAVNGQLNAQEKLKLIPEKPERGEKVTIRYNPNAKGATIPPEADKVDLVFTYSNLYEYPWRMPMVRNGQFWESSFVIPFYATYATFYLESNGSKDQPAPSKHFGLPVYENDKRVFNGYLFESYSLPAQMGKVPELEKEKALIIEKELQLYPDNYAAKLNLLNYKMSIAPDNEKVKLREQARQIIADKFYENPGVNGFMNNTTMGYLIIGENSRLDSIRQIVREFYPETQVGYGMRISEINQEEDTAVKAKNLHLLLRNETPANAGSFSNAHEILFKHYAALKEKEKALYHLDKINKEFTPYTPVEVKEQAEVLYHNDLALEKALRLAKYALVLADTFPLGLTRHFPETGYLPSFVSREDRQANTQKVTANMMTLMALIRLKQGFENEAQLMVAQALTIASDNETLAKAGDFYQLVNEHEKAFSLFKKIMMEVPEDTVSLSKMKNSFLKSNTASAWETQMAALNEHWKKQMHARLKKEMINIQAPEFLKAIVDLNGKPVSPALMKNKIVVVDFWATWCVPCIKEMPYVQNAYEKYKDHKDVLFMVVNSGSKNSLQDAQDWWGNDKFSFPVFYNKDRTIGTKFDFNVIPATYIIDQNGKIRFKTIGFEGPVIQRKIEVAIDMLKNGA